MKGQALEVTEEEEARSGNICYTLKAFELRRNSGDFPSDIAPGQKRIKAEAALQGQPTLKRRVVIAQKVKRLSGENGDHRRHPS